MRLQNYLNENTTTIDEIIDTLKENCGPFIKEIKGKLKTPLYRGSKYIVDGISLKKARIGDRNPLDTPVGIHNELNRRFRKKFGWPVRDGVFVSSFADVTKRYGNTYMFFPKDEYSYVWSPIISDLWDEINNTIITYVMEDEDHWYMWENDYGKYSKNGHWEYDGKKVSSEYIPNIAKELNMDHEDVDFRKVEWIPDVEYEDWLEKQENNIEKEKEGLYNSIIKRYTDKGLYKIGKFMNEISFNCKEYYLINMKFRTELTYWLISL